MNHNPPTIEKPSNTSAKDILLLVIEGALVGALAGLTIVIYRCCLTWAEDSLGHVLGTINGNIFYIVLWFAALILMACATTYIVRWEKMAGGSGLPQVSGEVQGHFDPSWWRVIIAKITGATIAILGGLSLGRGGPSIQLGAMAGKGYARVRHIGKAREILLLSCGAGAGLAATFNAPLAGILFTLEEVRHGIDRAILTASIAAAATATFTSRLFFGQGPIFSYPSAELPLRYLWLLVLFGILLGLAGAGFNSVMLKTQALFGYFKKIPKVVLVSLVFIISGMLGLVLPNVLAGGRSMTGLLEHSHPAFVMLIILLAVKFLFTMLSVGTGAPGGIFFPLLVLGSYLGAIYGDIVIRCLPISGDLWYQFIILGMAGLFAGIIRTPLTSILLIAEMTGSTHSMLDIGIVSVFAYATANLVGSKPISVSLLENMLKPVKH